MLHVLWAVSAVTLRSCYVAPAKCPNSDILELALHRKGDTTSEQCIFPKRAQQLTPIGVLMMERLSECAGWLIAVLLTVPLAEATMFLGTGSSLAAPIYGEFMRRL